MIAMAVVAVLAGQLPPQPPAEDIEIIGQRLRAADVRVRVGRGGLLTCRVARSTRDRVVDRELERIACGVIRTCRGRSPSRASIERCVDELWEPEVQRLAERMARGEEIGDAQD